MKVGLFFGSFNPVHIGHLAIANYIVEYGSIDRVWFVVSPQNPFKKKNNLANDYDRLEMVNLAIKDDFRFLASDIEFRLPIPSYTVNTLTYLKERHPQTEFILIMGADNFQNLSKWHNYEVLVSDYELMVYPRPGYTPDFSAYPGKVTRVDAPLMEISSSLIRKAISEKRDLRYFLPEEVFQYIEKHHLYEQL